MHQCLGRDRQHDHRGDRERAEGDGPPSTITAINTTPVMKNDRWVATSAPDKKR
jgi:hypothetical protein